MGFADYIVVFVIAAVIIGAVIYIIRAKKKGNRCVGCSACSENGTCTGCHCKYS